MHLRKYPVHLRRILRASLRGSVICPSRVPRAPPGSIGSTLRAWGSIVCTSCASGSILGTSSGSIARACSEVSCELPGYPVHLWKYREHPACLGKYPVHLWRYRVCLWASLAHLPCKGGSILRTSGSILCTFRMYPVHLQKASNASLGVSRARADVSCAPVTRPARERKYPVHPPERFAPLWK